MVTKRQTTKKTNGGGGAKQLTAAAKAAAARARQTGKDADKTQASELSEQAARAIAEENRRRFLRLLASHISTAVNALDRAAMLCERRKYRVLETDETMLKAVSDGLADLIDAMAVAKKRKRSLPTAEQILRTPAGSFAAAAE